MIPKHKCFIPEAATHLQVLGHQLGVSIFVLTNSAPAVIASHSCVLGMGATGGVCCVASVLKQEKQDGRVQSGHMCYNADPPLQRKGNFNEDKVSLTFFRSNIPAHCSSSESIPPLLVHAVRRLIISCQLSQVSRRK